VECFGAENRCLITPRCRLRGVLSEALSTFLSTLDKHTLADIMLASQDFPAKADCVTSAPIATGRSRGALLGWHDRRRALVLNEERDELGGLRLARVTADHMDVVRPFEEGLTLS
jgi:hypothetical protein